MNLMKLASMVPKLKEVKTEFVKADENDLTIVIKFADKESFNRVVELVNEFRGE